MAQPQLVHLLFHQYLPIYIHKPLFSVPLRFAKHLPGDQSGEMINLQLGV